MEFTKSDICFSHALEIEFGKYTDESKHLLAIVALLSNIPEWVGGCCIAPSESNFDDTITNPLDIT